MSIIPPSPLASVDAKALPHGDTPPEKMTAEECFQRFYRCLNTTRNNALRNFNKMNDDFKFVILTLANRHAPGAFQAHEIGKPFEYFDRRRRVLIIKSMNEIARWGDILPRRISEHESVLPE